MKNIRRILVAVKDASARSLPAVNKAVQIAKACGAQVELFHGISTPVYASMELTEKGLTEIQRTRRAEYLSRLEVIAERARKQNAQVSAEVQWDYPPHEAIIRRATRTKADLIVAECHAGKHMAPWLLQLTDWELLRHSPVPVLVVKSKGVYRNPVILAAVDPTHANAKPSKLDDEILQTASLVKQALRGTLHAVHAYVPLPMDAKPSELLSEEAVARLDRRARQHARALFTKALQKVTIAPSKRHLLGRHPVNAIPETARDIGSDIVVMGAVSRSGLKRLFIGNTAERILDDLTCDVLVVKPREFVSRVDRKDHGVQLMTAPLPLPY